MKLVLHIGMHKTGSTSIQKTFDNYARGGIYYLGFFNPNHSALYPTLFMENPEKYGAHKKNNRSMAEVEELKARFSKKIETFIDGLPDDATVVSSAEDLIMLKASELKALKAWAEKRFSQIHVIGYVRPPASLMTSSIQQRIVGGVKSQFSDLYPRYRQKFERFDDVFGRENVELVKFDKASLMHGDVVRDFAARIGADLPPTEVETANESRSLETTAVLYAQRALGRGWMKYPGSPRDNNTLVSRLKSLGGGKIVLDPDVMAEILAEQADDLDWITERLGGDFSDVGKKAPAEGQALIGKADDFLSIAAGKLPEVLDLIKAEAANREVDPQIVANAVDMLLDVIRDKRATQARRRK